MVSENTKKRNTTIDFAKGVTILLMLWEHLSLSNPWITTFHMPLFFILSGYFLKEERFKVTFTKKAKGLLIPYLVMELILVISSVVFTGIQNNYSLGDDKSWMIPIITEKLTGTLLANNFCISWFVWVLFGSTCLYALINKLRQRISVLYVILIIACSVLGYFLSTPWLRNPYRWDVILYVVPFIAIGHLYKLYGDKIQGYVKWILLTISLILWIVDIIFTDDYSIAMCVYGFYPLTLLGAIGGTYVVVNICSLLDKIPVLNTAIRWFGQNTIVIMCFAVVPSNVMEWYKDAYFGSVIISFIIQLAIVSLLILLWNGVKQLFHKIKEAHA